MDPIDEGAVELRVELANWPEGLDRTTFGAPTYLYNKLLSASLLFSEYRHVRAANGADTKLSPIGAQDANNAWIAERLPDVAKAIDEIRGRTKEAEAKLLAKLTAPFSTPPETPLDINTAQEIRTWLRSFPDHERTEKVGQLTRSGDLSALRAVLAAPAYLSGLEDTELAYIRDDAAKAGDPDRYAKLQALREAGKAAERAVEGVVRFLHQEAERAPPVLGSSPEPPPPLQPPLDPETVAAIVKATDEALARQAEMSAAA